MNPDTASGQLHRGEDFTAPAALQVQVNVGTPDAPDWQDAPRVQGITLTPSPEDPVAAAIARAAASLVQLGHSAEEAQRLAAALIQHGGGDVKATPQNRAQRRAQARRERKARR